MRGISTIPFFKFLKSPLFNIIQLFLKLLDLFPTGH